MLPKVWFSWLPKAVKSLPSFCVCPKTRLTLSIGMPLLRANVPNVWREQWNRTHKAAVSKQVTIKRNPFKMSGFALFYRMTETQRSAEW